MKNTTILLILILSVSLTAVPVYSTQTYLINEISAEVIREVFSSKEVIKKINELTQADFKWVEEFVHLGSGEFACHQFTLFFEKDTMTRVLRFNYCRIDKKISDMEILTGDEYKKQMGMN